MEKVFFKTFGCSNNFAESEIMKGLVKQNFAVTSSIEAADIVVLNLCTVKGDDASLSAIKKVKAEHPYKQLIIAGCIPTHLLKKIRELDSECGIINTHNIDQINSVIEEVINNHPIELVTHNQLVKLNFPRVRKNKIIAIIPISNSCIGKCSYCSVRPIKGTFYSFPEETILKEVKDAVESGCKEIWITSQDCGCYGIDINTNLAKLLEKIVDIEGEFYVRVGMVNPNNITSYLDELVKVFEHKKIFKFLHIPIQSGSNQVLQEMNRQYTVEDFRKIINSFRKVIPNISIATDVIVGFPTENDVHFQETCALIKGLKPDVINISKFRKRPNTPAFKLQSIDTKIVQNRSREMTRIFDWVGLDVNRKWKLKETTAIIDEEGKEGTLIARNIFYKQIIVPTADFKIGDKVKVKIKSFTQHYLVA
ncbi:tRNA (N(6)-L-threonylcarbamoyladenosine(37)-C(2))-methylthiotransferase [Candidatus Woesearchaeota archaeon]|jgi:threonylcarbamoyladenosine tRNA methylthiotransferase CDKAL1|nr:tRNA (N(6)-L-threonylcarbamoyladenosine(37)-C(2))-methylthiotransferase [Candidatus Woesearchaeota archaeon]MBT4368186.1 tRNA (N(6)-L-threonylcarbamoyladenosine(37)-C(2))-methylthiotransferase [Candidatus Woesearchaeota archaeon]MBT4712674.1 tRNA (N(6)-L-threonylcarbamoyladenosine(37)-C(2))-methylthiotransferase [Candidatus Woesearchaeota archaeon]MBT6639587.1 tRNA (N(6)-L-threonylcarbamoyladenosine(37)-C(2))-methylthiotransferase [Candidatus Woesearchaeota archaeon]MBT7133759.1 tRNA (N(6)-L